MRYCFFTFILLLIGAPGPARPLVLTATASSEASAEFAAGRLIDDDEATYWSSARQAEADHEPWARIDFGRTISLAGVRLTPRAAGFGFPLSYRIEYGYDAEGKAWFPVPKAEYSPETARTTPQTHRFVGRILAARLRIIATRLGADDQGAPSFQLAGLEPIEGTAEFPFATPVGPDLAAQFNMLWGIYGEVSDGSDAVFISGGSEPAWMEWMPLKFGWFAGTIGLREAMRRSLLDWPQSADGYIWSWRTQEKWPTGDGSFHQENNAKYILGCWRLWCWSRGADFFELLDRDSVTQPNAPSRPDVSGGMSLKQKLRLAMRYLEVEQRGNEGGIALQDNGMGNDGTVSGEPTNYWDNWRFGYQNPYDNIYYYAALEAMAQLEEEWGDSTRAAQLRQWREGCRRQYNDLFWDKDKGRYITTIDKSGRHWDFGSTFVNLEALGYGLADEAQGRRIFEWLDGRRVIPGDTSQGSDIYFWKFAPRANTLKIESIGPPYWWFDLNGAIPVGTAAARWPNHLENGGAIFYTSYYDLMARLRYTGADDAYARLAAIIDEFRVDQLRRDPSAPGSAPWQLGIIGEFPESGLVPCALVYGFAGIEPSRRGLHIRPNLPGAMRELTVRRVAYAGAMLDIKAGNKSVTIASSPNSSTTLTCGGRRLPPGREIVVDDIPAEGVLLEPRRP